MVDVFFLNYYALNFGYQIDLETHSDFGNNFLQFGSHFYVQLDYIDIQVEIQAQLNQYTSCTRIASLDVSLTRCISKT